MGKFPGWGDICCLSSPGGDEGRGQLSRDRRLPTPLQFLFLISEQNVPLFSILMLWEISQEPTLSLFSLPVTFILSPRAQQSSAQSRSLTGNTLTQTTVHCCLML